MPDTIPLELPTVATDGLLLVHIPPGVVEAKVVVLLTQNEVVPVIAAGAVPVTVNV